MELTVWDSTAQKEMVTREKVTATVIERTYHIAGKFGGFKIWRICLKMYMAVFKFWQTAP